MMETTCPYAIGATFVFLNLLKRKTQCLTELFLAHPEHCAALAHSAADVNVDRLGPASCADRSGALFLRLVCFVHVLIDFSYVIVGHFPPTHQNYPALPTLQSPAELQPSILSYV